MTKANEDTLDPITDHEPLVEVPETLDPVPDRVPSELKPRRKRKPSMKRKVRGDR